MAINFRLSQLNRYAQKGILDHGESRELFFLRHSEAVVFAAIFIGTFAAFFLIP